MKNQELKKKLDDKYKIKIKGIVTVIEDLKQRVKANAAKIERYESHDKQYRQNRLFQTNQRKLFEEIEGLERNTDIQPDANESKEFWSNTWSRRAMHNASAEWLQNIKEESKNIHPQADITITTK